MGVNCRTVRAHVQTSHIQHVFILEVLYGVLINPKRTMMDSKKTEDYSFGYLYSMCFATPIIARAYITASIFAFVYIFESFGF